MEALNAAGLTPLSVLSEKRTEPRKVPHLHTISQLKNLPKAAKLSVFSPRNINSGGGLVLLNCLLGNGLARALTYEEALEQSVDGFSSSEFDSIIDFIVNNPLVAGAGVAIVAVPLILAQILGGKPKAWGVESAKSAYAKLSEDVNAQLLDIRPPAELRKVGSPDVKGLKKKAVNVVYKGDDKLGFLKKLSLKFKEPENTTLFILDKFDGNSELVAELVTSNGFKAAYAIKDGAEGSRGWINSGLPWISPKAFSLDISSLTDAFSGSVGGGSDSLALNLGIVAAAAGLGILAFTEVETILQVLGSAALIQVISNKFLFAEDRKKTLQQVDEFLSTKVAPKELVDDVKQIGKALLPLPVTSKALPAATEASPEVNDAVVPSKVEAVTEVKEDAAAAAPSKVETVTEQSSTPEINSVPKAKAETDTLPPISTPLSPYPNYPDLKPPTSPMPSQP
ncbi:OLC1v1038404C1 [Oldenlandia corymbosa var. corymbosa]|uniref:OLC1v1038404C1 n=1 Tax=Oldenlandia corymbosa var. corymbosa TaxID=529605 RepID=A0AAV1D202_OLDCO|nr:OLC1v1038404C1 [Oldenlandia corymbosa var. corymbosa]